MYTCPCHAAAIGANVPVDFVDEKTAAAGGKALSAYKMIVVTEPNMPAGAVSGLLAWAHSGGTLVAVSNAGCVCVCIYVHVIYLFRAHLGDSSNSQC